MSTGIPGEAVAAVAQVAGEVIRADADNPRWDGSKDNAAFAVEAITGIVKTALLPLAVVNRKATEYFERGLNADLADALKEVPPKAISTPLPSVAGPALQGLGYSFEEEELRVMYVRLIASAMDGRLPGKAHPSYAPIVSALSASEAKYLPAVLTTPHPLVEYREATTPDAMGYEVLQTNILPMQQHSSKVLVLDDRLPEYLVNWQRLGLVNIDWLSYLTASDAYAWAEEHPLGSRLRQVIGDKLQIQNGVLSPTPFGRAFALAVLPDQQKSEFSVRSPGSVPVPVPTEEAPPQP